MIGESLGIEVGREELLDETIVNVLKISRKHREAGQFYSSIAATEKDVDRRTFVTPDKSTTWIRGSPRTEMSGSKD